MRMKFQSSALLTASVLLAACSGVGDYKGPQDMDATDMTVASEDMPEAASDMSATPQDMGTTSGEDMPDTPNTPAPPALTAKGTAAGVELAWSPVPDALRYEVRIDGGDWINVLGELTYLDEEAPVGAITSATVSASDATRREAVDLTIEELQTEEGSQRTYEVRAITADATTEPSNQESASRITEITGYQWQYTDSLENPDWRDIDGATTESAEDPGARGNGNARHYRVEISTNAPEPILSETDAGFRLAAVQVSVGEDFTCVLLNNKRVKCWGGNDFGQLGAIDRLALGNQPSDMPPPYVNLGGDVAQIAAGSKRVCALMEDGQLKCWGNLYVSGRPEDNIGDDPGEMPPPVIPLGGKIKAMNGIGLYHHCVIMETGNVKCWGLNRNGALGLGDVEPRGPNPADLPPPDVNLGAKALNIGHYGDSTCAILENEELKCWGGNIGDISATLTDEHVGDEPGEMPPPSLPVLPQGWRPYRLSEGYFSQTICVIGEYIENGSFGVFCWGLGSSGQLGKGNTENLGVNAGDFPISRTRESKTNAYTTYSTTCIWKEGEDVKCWGVNPFTYPSLGPEFFEPHGDEMSELSAKPISLGIPVVDFSLGLAHSCAVTSAGEVKCWGVSTKGQLGNENTTPIGEDMTTWPPPNVKLY